MKWLTEDPTYSIMMGLLLTGAFAAFAFMLKQRLLWVLAALSFLIMVGLVITERVIVTDYEQVRADVFDLADAVQRNDVDKVLSYVSESMPTTRSRVRNEMPQYHFRTCRILGFNEISFDEESQTATADFVVYVDLNAMKTYQYDGSGTRRVNLKFQKEPGGWKIIDYSHRHPQSRDAVQL